jgi:hypothetical protein
METGEKDTQRSTYGPVAARRINNDGQCDMPAGYYFFGIEAGYMHSLVLAPEPAALLLLTLRFVTLKGVISKFFDLCSSPASGEDM